MKYYVYLHIDGNEIVYVGKGIDGRAWSTCRNDPEHKKWMKEKLPNNITIKFEALNLTENKALYIEHQLIKNYNPKFNGKLGPKCKEDYLLVTYIDEDDDDDI